MNALSRREEDELKKSVKAQAMKECDAFVREFVECSKWRTFSMFWVCKSQLKALQNCLYQYQGPESMERVRAEYIRVRDINAAQKAASSWEGTS